MSDQLPRQLPLPFLHQPVHGVDFLAAPSNAAARAWLEHPDAWPGGRLVVWGESGVGKTHLLSLWASQCGGQVLAGTSLRGLPSVPSGPLALDDADTAAERPLLHLINVVAEAGQILLLSGQEPPARWAVRLPDLASRLRATQAVAVESPEEALRADLLARLLAERQITVAGSLQIWLLLRLPRNAAAVREAVRRIDRMALAAGRPVSRPMLVRILADLADFDDEMVAPTLDPSPALPGMV